MTGSRKILIVEDNEDIATIYNFVLKKKGYETRIARDGKQALHEVIEFEPEIILLDLMVPEIDGIEILETVREDEKYKHLDPLVLVATNVMQEDMSDAARRSGADGYVIKANINNQELPELIEELVRRGRNNKKKLIT